MTGDNFSPMLVAGGNEMAARMRDKDWSRTLLGPPQQWPQSLRTAVEIILSSRYPMFVWWGRELINLYNDPYAPLLGKKHPAALGQPASKVWSEIWDQIGPRTDAVLLRGESTFDERLLLMMDRHGYMEEAYFTFSYSPLPDDDGKIGGLFCAVTEETDRVIGERRLRVLRTVATKAGEGRSVDKVCQITAQCLADADRDLPFALIYLHQSDSRQLRRVACIGFPEDHAAAPEILHLGPSDPWGIEAALDSNSAKVLTGLGDRFGDLPTGAWQTLPSSALVVPLAQQGDGAPVGVLIAGANPHRRIDDEFFGFIGLLAGQIAAEIANANAYEAERKRAEALAELDRAKTAFFSNVSHEFRTPLTLLLGPLEEALERTHSRSSEDRQRLETAHRNAMRLLKLVNSLLDFSRIESGRMLATYEPVDLAALTSNLASGFRSLIEAAGLSYTVDCPPIPDETFVDTGMWEKIVLNIISNAYKFTLDGGITVRQSLQAGKVVLEVSDTGIGIPESEAENVFQRFQRVEGSKGRSIEGTGIGLALVQELVKLHGGSISVAGAEGSGTTFTVTIPSGCAHLPAERVRREPARSDQTQTATLFEAEAARWTSATTFTRTAPDATETSGTTVFPSALPRVLVVDDNADMREYVGRLLRAQYHVEFACNGEEAMAIIASSVPDLILSDIMMPRIDGIELLQILRARPETRTVPVIMISARAGEEASLEGLHAGADDYLAKPFTSAELIARVATQVNLSRARRKSERRERELRRAAESAQLAVTRVLDSITDAVVMLDREWRITYANPQAARIEGKSTELFVRRTYWQEWPASLGSEIERQFRHAVEERVPVEFEHHYQDAARDIILGIRAYPVDDGLAVFYRDITEQRRTHEALLRSEKLAAVGRLAASIAHEINNPLEAVTNLLYLIETNVEREDIRTFATLAGEQLRRVSHIATQTLRFHRQSTSATPASIPDILETVLSVYQGRCANSGVVIVRRFRGNAPVFCYDGEVRQVFSNIICNSIDAMPNGGRLILRTRPSIRRSDGIPGMLVTIADNGFGIPESARRKLFEAFFTTKGITGTGLGLWISSDIVHKHHGDIRWRSSQDKRRHGTVFQVFFPLSAARPSQDSSRDVAACA